MRDDYLMAARKIVADPYILVNVVSLRVKQLRHGSRPLVESLEKLSFEDTALREVAEGKIGFELAESDLQERSRPSQRKLGFHPSPIAKQSWTA